MESRKLGPFALPLLLLVLSVLINYIDRGNLSIAAPLLKDELGLSASQLGILFSAFFWTYTVMLFVCGWFIDRFDVNRVLAFGLSTLVARHGSHRHRLRVYNAPCDATAAWHWRIRGISVLFQDFGATPT